MKYSYPRLAVTIILCVAAAHSAQAAIEYADITGGRVHGEERDGLASFKVAGSPTRRCLERRAQGRHDTPILVGFTSDEAGAQPPKVLVDWMESMIARSGCKEAQTAVDALLRCDRRSAK
jgi:hypothetical protein